MLSFNTTTFRRTIGDMKKLLFSLKLAAGALQSQDADFAVSLPFDPPEVMDRLIDQLGVLGYVPNIKTIRFVLKEECLFVEGLADEDQSPPEPDLIMGS